MGNLPKPETIDLPTGPAEAYKARKPDGTELTPRDLPKQPGYVWKRYQNLKGEIYYVKVSDAGDRQRAELEKRDAERRARERMEAEAEAAKPKEKLRVGEHSGMEIMRQEIAERRRQLSDVFGAKLSASALGKSVDIFKGGVSTSVEGQSVGPATLDKNGNLVAVDAGPTKVTQDGRMIVGKSVERLGVKVTAKGAVSMPDAVSGGTSAGVELVVDAFEKRLPGLGQIKGE